MATASGQHLLTGAELRDQPAQHPGAFVLPVEHQDPERAGAGFDDVAPMLIDLVGADTAHVVALGLKHGRDRSPVRRGRGPAADQPHTEAHEMTDADRERGACPQPTPCR